MDGWINKGFVEMLERISTALQCFRDAWPSIYFLYYLKTSGLFPSKVCGPVVSQFHGHVTLFCSCPSPSSDEEKLSWARNRKFLNRNRKRKSQGHLFFAQEQLPELELHEVWAWKRKQSFGASALPPWSHFQPGLSCGHLVEPGLSCGHPISH